MIEATWGLVAAIIGIALVFDFTNGFHDSANSISTVVSTKVLSPRNAVVFAAFFNFAAAFGFGVAVANTVSNIIHLDFVAAAVIPYIVLGALVGAITWNLITWFSGLPTSSSHALIGGLAGAGISAAGLAAIRWDTVVLVATFMFLSPMIGLTCGFLFMAIVLWLTQRANKQSTETYFKKLHSVLPQPTVSATVPTMHRRPSGSSSRSSFPSAISALRSIPTTCPSRSGSSCSRIRSSRSAPLPEAGVSSRPWATTSPGSARSMDLLRRPQER